MKTYQIQYQMSGLWNDGIVLMMEPCHLSTYLAFLDGDRPLATIRHKRSGEAHVTTLLRKKGQGAPTRVQAVDVDWEEHDGYYQFDGIDLTWMPIK